MRLLHSNSCMCPVSSAWPSWGSRGASYTGQTALSAAWPETPTAPGTDRPAPDSSPAARGTEQGDAPGGYHDALIQMLSDRSRGNPSMIAVCDSFPPRPASTHMHFLKIYKFRDKVKFPTCS